MSGAIWRSSPPASESAIARLRNKAPVRLPADYLVYLAGTNGGEGDLGVDPGWIQLWSADEVLAHNEGYCIGESLPGCFAFATNGGGELIVFDARGTEPYPVLMVPFIPMEIESAVRIAGSFSELQAQLGVPSSEIA